MLLQRPVALFSTASHSPSRSPVGLTKFSRSPLRVVVSAEAVKASISSGFTSSAHPTTGPARPSPRTPSVICRSEAGGGGSGGGPRDVGKNGGGTVGGAGGGCGPVGPSGPGGGPSPQLPGGWTWRQLLLVALGFAMTLPLVQYIRERIVQKPELKPGEDFVKPKKARSALGKAVDSVKHSTVDPVKDRLNKFAPRESMVEEAKRSEPVRGVQHKAEDVKDKVDNKFYDATSKAERGYSHLQKDVKHGAEDMKEKGSDVLAGADRTVHKTAVRGSRVVGERAPEKASDAAYETRKATKGTGRSVMDNLKGGASKVGRALHIVTNSTEKGAKEATSKAEKAMEHVKEKTTEEQRKNAYYAAGGVALGLATLGGLYYYDRQGGDLGGKFKKMQGKTRELTNKSASAAQDAACKTSSAAKDASSLVQEKGKESLEKAKEFAAERRAGEPTGVFGRS